jgi:SPP1 gp7 family putative phage head morphogenesis protein
LGDSLLASYLLGLDQIRERSLEYRLQSGTSFAEGQKEKGPTKVGTLNPDNPIDLRFDVAPKEAIDYFKRKKIVSKSRFNKLEADARHAAFTVGGVYRQDVLQGFHREITRALETGATQRETVKRFKSILAGAGHEQLGDFHLETVFRTNMGMAYGVGRRRGMEEVTDDLPYWTYHAVGDDRTRPTHQALDGVTLRFDNEFWASHYPQWEFNCRCSVTPADSLPDDYDPRNPSGRMTEYGDPVVDLSYDDDGVPVKAEVGTSLLDLGLVGKFRGIPSQLGLRDVIEDGAARAEASRAVDAPHLVIAKGIEIANEPVEHLHFFDRDGELVSSFTGQQDDVFYDLTAEEEKRVAFELHNHPDSVSFSLGDILGAARLGVEESRVVSPRFVYTMQPPPGGWTKDLIKQLEPAFAAARLQVVRDLQREVVNRAIKVQDFPEEERHRTWKKVAQDLGLRYKRLKR